MGEPTIILLATTCALLVGGGLYVAERHKERTGRRHAAAQDDGDKLRQMIRDRGIWAVGRMLLSRRQPAMLRHRQTIADQDARIAAHQTRLDALGHALLGDKGWSVGAIAVRNLVAAAWLVFFILQILLDFAMLSAVGYPPGLALALGCVIAIGISALGVMIWGALGLHALHPALGRLRRSGRVTVALVLAIPVIGLVAALPRLAIYRSQATIGNQVRQLSATLAQEQATTPQDPVEIAVTRQDLTAAQQRLATGKQLDQTLAVIVPVLELVTSPAAISAGELAVAAWLSASIAAATRRRRAAERRLEAEGQQFMTGIIDLGVEMGYAPEEIEGGLLPPEAETPVPEPSRPGTPPAASPPPDPAPGSDPGPVSSVPQSPYVSRPRGSAPDAQPGPEPHDPHAADGSAGAPGGAGRGNPWALDEAA